METDEPTTDRLAVAEIRAMAGKFSAAEARLVKLLSEAWRSGADKGLAMPEPEFRTRIRVRALALLDGDVINEKLGTDEAPTKPKRKTLGEKVLPPEKGELPYRGVPHLHIELGAVRLIQQGLAQQNLAAEAAEALATARARTPEFSALRKELLLIATRFAEIEDRYSEFLDGIGPAPRAALPGPFMPFALDGRWMLDDATEQAIEAGLVTRGEIARARKGKDN